MILDSYFIVVNDPAWPIIAVLWGAVALALFTLLVTGGLSSSRGYFAVPWMREDVLDQVVASDVLGIREDPDGMWHTKAWQEEQERGDLVDGDGRVVGSWAVIPNPNR